MGRRERSGFKPQKPPNKNIAKGPKKYLKKEKESLIFIMEYSFMVNHNHLI